MCDCDTTFEWLTTPASLRQTPDVQQLRLVAERHLRTCPDCQELAHSMQPALSELQTCLPMINIQHGSQVAVVKRPSNLEVLPWEENFTSLSEETVQETPSVHSAESPRKRNGSLNLSQLGVILAASLVAGFCLGWLTPGNPQQPVANGASAFSSASPVAFSSQDSSEITPVLLSQGCLQAPIQHTSEEPLMRTSSTAGVWAKLLAHSGQPLESSMAFLQVQCCLTCHGPGRTELAVVEVAQSCRQCHPVIQ
ncbi:Hypothetical protein PBC10988_14090 [Planctomycetales bacterium 10988]|nr:Hypothetical protein PBC10988_14090 [Planctomycetales bacterium 10988]